MQKSTLLRLKGLVIALLFLSPMAQASPPLFSNFTQENGAGKTSFDWFLTQAPCEIICPGDLNFTLASGECGMVVNYVIQTTGDCLPSVPVQTSGLPSGSVFPIGVTQNCFVIDLDPIGSPDGDVTCCFNVTVNDYPNPTSALVCNDLVYVALDADCQYCINGADVMEGGPYRCYDSYLVELDKTAPFGNGPWVSACVGASDINKTYQVRVTDPATGNKCWGSVKIEDKIPPVLVCRDFTINCNADPNLNLTPAPAITGYQKKSLAGLSDAIGAAGSATPDVHTYSFDYNYLPAGTLAQDVNCRIKVAGHPALSDLKIVVTAPDGTIAEVFTTTCNGQVWPLDALLDDEGADILADCALLNANGAAVQCQVLGVSNAAVLNVFDGKNSSGTWTVTISDNVAGEAGLIELVGLEVLVDVPQAPPPVDNCGGPATVTYIDTEVAGDCANYIKVIDRAWYATDDYGNVSSCVQHINFLAEKLADVTLPSNYDDIDAPSFSCNDGTFPSPEWIESQGQQGFPWIGGAPFSCNLAASYADVILPVCEGTYKIRREWTVIDWCAGNVITHNQTIKVFDAQGPSMTCPQGLTASTDIFTCCATVNLPDLVISDACSRIQSIGGVLSTFDPNTGLPLGMAQISGTLTDFPGNDFSNPDTLAAFGSTACLPRGTHLVEYLAVDDCGNTATCSFQLTVVDYIPPVAACDELTVVAIGIDDPTDCYGPAGPNGNPAAFDACTFAGVSWVKAPTFDDGSYDACGNVKFTIQRQAPYSDCILDLNAINGGAPCDDASLDTPSEFERAVAESDSIKFYACEVGTFQTIILRVYQVDANGNIALDANGFPLKNECAIEVNVLDKIKPACIPPANVAVTCDQFDPSLLSYGNAQLLDNCCLDTTQNYLAQCGLSHTINYENFDTLCNTGTILRQFMAFDCNGNSSSCTQQIAVNYKQDYYIHFPNDVILTECSATGNFGEPTFFGEDCELLGVSYSDEVFTVVPDACFKIERTWTIINWCTYNPVLPVITVPNPKPNAIENSPANLPGPIVSSCDAVAPWNATVVKINPTDPAETNYCTFWNENANAYQYKQVIKVIDTEAPVIANCPSGPSNLEDITANDPALWHNVFNPSLPTQDLSEVAADLSIASSDACSGSNLSEISFQLFLDLDQDGAVESVLSSSNLPGADSIHYNNINTPGYLGGTPVAFDARTVPTNQKWHFALQQSTTPTQSVASVRWTTELSPSTFVVPQLPQGTHKIKWTVRDFCGNETVCEHTFTVQQGQSSGIETLEGDGFALYQNEPNPFVSSTKIGFQLPKAAQATLSVYDLEGRLVFGKTDQFKEGYNAIQLEGSWLNTPAVFYYKLESGAHVAWKKMVLMH